MIGHIASMLTNMLSKTLPATSEQREVYQYGFDIMIYTITSTLCLAGIGLLAREIIPTIICISVFYTNQTFGGGYHAKTHLRCFMTMVFGLLVYLLAIRISCSPFLWFICAAVAISVLYSIPLVLHQNKQYLAYKKNIFIFRSRCITVLQTCICIWLYCVDSLLLSNVGTALLLCAISRIVGAITGKFRVTPD